MVEQEASEIISYLKEYGADKKVLGIDIVDIPLYKALEKAGITIGDGQAPMVEARMIKTPDEIELLKCSAAMVDAVYWQVAKHLHPGVTENEMEGLIQGELFRMGAESVEFVNCISGMRGNPHSHTTSNRMIRPGELVYFDVGKDVYKRQPIFRQFWTPWIMVILPMQRYLWSSAIIREPMLWREPESMGSGLSAFLQNSFPPGTRSTRHFLPK